MERHSKDKNKFKLSSVRIRGYKSISYKYPMQLDLENVNILLGANGAGKSNIISFFKMMSYMMSKSFAKYVELSGSANQLLHFGPKNTPTMSATLKFTDGRSTNEYTFSLANAMSDRLIITDEKVQWHKDGEKKPYNIQIEPNFKESALA